MATAIVAVGRLVLAALAISVAGCTASSSTVSRSIASGSTAPHSGAPGAATTLPATATAGTLPTGRAVTSLERPGSLAMGPGGRLYIADDARNQILLALPGGGFRVVAGTGRAGFSGDGGPAVDAALNDPGGMTVSRSGTLYVADTGNNRIRAISPGGIISTVAGDGQWAWVAGGTPALRASLGGPADVAIAPDGALYIADVGNSEILTLTPAGRLAVVAGIPSLAGRPVAGLLATETSADGPFGLAFNHAGDLYVAGENTKNLFMIAPDGRVSLPIGAAGFYPRGNGGLVTAPDGSILAMNTLQVDQISGDHLQVLYNLRAYPHIGVTGFVPDGIAVAPDGDIYLDTWLGNGFADKTALIEIRPTGTAGVIWESY